MTTPADKRILVVDDEPDVRNFLAAIIEDAGFQVRTAVDGVDALEKIQEQAPDLMTLDMVMPRKSGIHLMRTLRAEPEWAEIPVIVITAHARDEMGSEDIKGFSAFAARHRPRYIMEKPVTPEKLVQAIGDILEVSLDSAADASAAEGGPREKLKNLIDDADPDTVLKISSLLNQAKT